MVNVDSSASGQQPPPVPLAFVEAVKRQEAGDLSTARMMYLDLIDSPELTSACLHQLGRVAFTKGEIGKAVDLLRITLRINPDDMMAYSDLFDVFERVGDLNGSLSILNDLVCRLYVQGKQAESADICWKILDRAPLYYAAWVNLGTCLARLGEYEKAAPCIVQSIRLYGRLFPEVEEFISDFEKRIEDRVRVAKGILPEGYPVGPVDKIEDAMTTLGKILCDMGCRDEAILCFRQVLKMYPGFALTHWNLSLALLENKKWEEGWREYEWRWNWENFTEVKRVFPAPLWHGEPLSGKRILVWSEQGYGDGIQFLPLIAMLQKMGCDIVLECPAPLVRLFSHCLENVVVITRIMESHKLAPCPPLDYVVPMMGLPVKLGLRVEDLPLAVNYLRPLSEDEGIWKKRIPQEKRKISVGVVWAGQKLHSEDKKRTLSVKMLEKLFSNGNASFYSLQCGERQKDIAELTTSSLVDLSPFLNDFADTAAAISCLDLVISIDTSVAHLAGAMGKTVWILLPEVPDWRWLNEHDHVPWYPSMRIFRQKNRFDWDEVIAKIGNALSGWNKNKS